jgi:hypothetical protein
MLRLEVESGAERLYTPVDSQASKDRDFLDNIYPSNQNIQSVDVWELLILTKDRGNMLTSAFLDDVKSVDNFIRNLSFITTWETTLKFTDLCLKRSGDCLLSGDVFLSTDFQQMMLVNNITYPIFMQTTISSLLANPSASKGLLTSAIGVKLSYYLHGGYSDQFIKAIPDAVFKISEIAYSYSQAIDDELEKNIGGDILFYALTIVLMMTYASTATSRMDCNFIADRSLLGQAGVFSAVISILPSFGFVSLIGVKYMSIVGIIPFLIIGKIIVVIHI